MAQQVAVPRPLQPSDTSSQRATLHSFLGNRASVTSIDRNFGPSFRAEFGQPSFTKRFQFSAEVIFTDRTNEKTFAQ